MRRKTNIGKSAKAIRESIGFTQTMVANFLECDEGLVSKFEAGEESIRAEVLERMFTLYGCTIQSIRSGSCNHTFNMALTASEYSPADLNAIHDINRIAINARFISSL